MAWPATFIEPYFTRVNDKELVVEQEDARFFNFFVIW